MRVVNGYASAHIPLGKLQIKVPGLMICLSSKEIEEIVDVSNEIWSMTAFNFDGDISDYTGPVRFDFVPFIDNDGLIKIRAVLEINMHSIECLAAEAAMFYLKIIQDTPCINLFVKKVKATFGDRIVIVVGRCLVKKSWNYYFIKALRRAGLKVDRMYPRQVMNSKPEELPPMYLWSDVRVPPERSQLSSEFVKFLFDNQDRFDIFPSLKGRAMAKKDLLPEKWAPRFDMSEALSLDKGLIFMKPNDGSSGDGAFSGKYFAGSDRDWQNTLKRCIAGGNYVAWENKPLPKREFKSNSGRTQIRRFDANTTFWVKNGVLEQDLYTVFRSIPDEKYCKNKGLMNVAKDGDVFRLVPHHC